MSQRHGRPTSYRHRRKRSERKPTASGSGSTVELQDVANQVSAGLDPADCHEPGAAWKPVHHHDPEVARAKVAKRTASSGTGR